MSRALDTLARLRRLQTDEAKATVDRAIMARDAAEARQTKARTALAREMQADAAQGGSYAAWLPVAFAAIHQTQAQMGEAERARQSAVQVLVGHKAALKAVERIMELRTAAAKKREAARAQVRLDDAARLNR